MTPEAFENSNNAFKIYNVFRSVLSMLRVSTPNFSLSLLIVVATNSGTGHGAFEEPHENLNVEAYLLLIPLPEQIFIAQADQLRFS